jgi:hypothetical protein
MVSVDLDVHKHLAKEFTETFLTEVVYSVASLADFI